ncbi:MAG: cysteine--tRNA ligase [Candidatus Gracilibacteria bacterium]|nr:cysteine--tRNA ligase [Candidatus Gracilibacteria bacterium]MDD2909258.1 cysteine--tRNA ligase [Candidatus Gracilibacteria bacterium]
MLQLTNTLTRKKENFKPLREEKVKVYFCGPTPYNYSHIGNLRAYLFSDMVVRTMRFLGNKVETVMNFTDIDDKTIKQSIEQNISLKDLTQKFSNLFLEDLEKLGINKADNISPISDLIPEMVLIINGLLDKGYAYLADDSSIYFSISKFKTYGELAHLDIAGMKSSVRINNDEYEKEEVADFALWKAYDETKDGPNKWEGKFTINGEEKVIYGRPGWHIECSACNMKYFGPQIDLHMGGIDNIFPHHQNEIAQTEAYTGKTFSKYWMHNGHVLVDNKKMAKSKDNFYTLRDLEEKTKDLFSSSELYRGYRIMNLQARYEESFNFTFDKLNQAVVTLKGFDEVLRRIKSYKAESGKFQKEVSENIQSFIQRYIEFLEDDFDTPNALTIIFECIKYINSGIDENLFSSEEINALVDLLKTFDQVLNFIDFSILEKDIEIPEEVAELLAKRIEAKIAKNYSLADEIRIKIEELGFVIKDDKSGSRVEKK